MIKAMDDNFDPFTAEDHARIFHEESCDHAAEGWEPVSKTENAEVWRKRVPDSPIHMVKGFLKFSGVPPEAVAEMVTNYDVRRRWDVQFPVIELLQQLTNYQVVYWRIRTPPAIADRDLVQFATHGKDEASGAYYVMYKNGHHDSKPPQPGVVRAETILSATIIRPDENDSSSSRVCILLQNDAKGWIPKFIINHIQARAPGAWRDSLYNFFVKEYSKEYWAKVKSKQDESQ